MRKLSPACFGWELRAWRQGGLPSHGGGTGAAGTVAQAARRVEQGDGGGEECLWDDMNVKGWGGVASCQGQVDATVWHLACRASGDGVRDRGRAGNSVCPRSSGPSQQFPVYRTGLRQPRIGAFQTRCFEDALVSYVGRLETLGVESGLTKRVAVLANLDATVAVIIQCAHN